jgi:hypothetical protein
VLTEPIELDERIELAPVEVELPRSHHAGRLDRRGQRRGLAHSVPSVRLPVLLAPLSLPVAPDRVHSNAGYGCGLSPLLLVRGSNPRHIVDCGLMVLQRSTVGSSTSSTLGAPYGGAVIVDPE